MFTMTSAGQILRQAENLKASLVENGRSVPESSKVDEDGGRGEDSGKGGGEGHRGSWDLWVTRQKLEDIYKRLLLMDLEYALDKKVEQDLWNHAFKNQITALQMQAKDKYNPKKGDVQANLNLFLETASGFYLQFLQLICSTFKLDLPFRRKSLVFGVMKEKTQLRTKITPPKKSSCLYICQYCLVHLGDIARYRQQVEQAQTYYRHAVNLSPQNGQPYNQLAILEVNRNNKLSSVFYYVRSLAVRHPFPVAATNLEKFYAKLIKDTSEFRGKMTQNEFVNAFLQFQALLHLAADLNRASYLSERILHCLPSHLVSGTFSASVLVQCVAITIFTLNHVRHIPCGGDAAASALPVPLSPKGEGEGGSGGVGRENGGLPSSGQGLVETMLSSEEKRSLDIILGFTACVLELLIQHAPSMPSKARESATLPAIQVLVDWLRHSADIIMLPHFTSSSIWGHLARLLNTVQQYEDGKPAFDITKYDEVPLPEDTELRCFQPLEKAHSKYSFSRIPVDGFPRGVEELVRCTRLVNQGKAITDEFPELKMTAVVQNDPPCISFSGPMVTKNDAQPSPQERRAKQNVAMQAIMKHGQGSLSDVSKDGMADAGQQKYLLGTATNAPQFMKHGGGGSTGRLQPSPQVSPGFVRRAQSPQARGSSSPLQGIMSPRVASPRPGNGSGAASGTTQPLQPQQSPNSVQVKKPPQTHQQSSLQQQQKHLLPQKSQKHSQSNPLPPRFQQQQQQQQYQQQQQQQQPSYASAPASPPSSGDHLDRSSGWSQPGGISSALTGHTLAPYTHPGIAFQGQPFGQGQGPVGQGHIGQGHPGQAHQHQPLGLGLSASHPAVGQGLGPMSAQTGLQNHGAEGSGGGGAAQASAGGIQRHPSYMMSGFPGVGAERQFRPGPGMGLQTSTVLPQQMEPSAPRMPQPQAFLAGQRMELGGGSAALRHSTPSSHPLNQEMLSALRLASQISHKQTGPGREDLVAAQPTSQMLQHQQSAVNPLAVQGMLKAPIQRPGIMTPRGMSMGGPPALGHTLTASQGPYPGQAANFTQPWMLESRAGLGGGVEVQAMSASRPMAPGRAHSSLSGHDPGLVGQAPVSRLPAPPIPLPASHRAGNGSGYTSLLTSLFQQDEGAILRGSEKIRGFQALSPLTIQPPKFSPPDTRLSSSFQGHAEGTPKPDKQDMASDSREVEPIVQGQRVMMPMAQPGGGEYSLFASSSPWSMPLNSSSDCKSMASSPFSSQASSIRSSPVVDLQGSGSYRGEGWMSQGQGLEDARVRGQQAMWADPPTMTPLERLLEQQRHQRQSDPH